MAGTWICLVAVKALLMSTRPMSKATAPAVVSTTIAQGVAVTLVVIAERTVAVVVDVFVAEGMKSALSVVVVVVAVVRAVALVAVTKGALSVVVVVVAVAKAVALVAVMMAVFSVVPSSFGSRRSSSFPQGGCSDKSL